MFFYSIYKEYSIGRMLHFIYHYCGLQYAENVVVGDKFITYYNKDFAKIEWKEIDFHNQKVIIPVFEFLINEKEYFMEKQIQKQNIAIITLEEMKDKLKDKWIVIYRQESQNESDKIKELNKKLIEGN